MQEERTELSDGTLQTRESFKEDRAVEKDTRPPFVLSCSIGYCSIGYCSIGYCSIGYCSISLIAYNPRERGRPARFEQKMNLSHILDRMERSIPVSSIFHAKVQRALQLWQLSS